MTENEEAVAPLDAIIEVPIEKIEKITAVVKEKIKTVDVKAGTSEAALELWVPKTDIGKKVKSGEITSISEILKEGKAILEVEIVDRLLPNLEEEIINVRRVQRMLDSGRRMRFSILTCVGDRNGHVGVGLAKGVEVGPAIKKSVNKAKMNIMEIRRGCSSWECGCMEPHTVPFLVSGKCGSVRVQLKPGPRGLGLVASDNSKKILQLAGIKDIWTSSKGHTRTTINQVMAVYNALKGLDAYKVSKKEVDMLAIKKGNE